MCAIPTHSFSDMGAGTSTTATYAHLSFLISVPPLALPNHRAYIYRICPGKHFAEASLFIMIASILHAVTIEHALDENGHPITPEAKMTYGVIS